jgi:hypothetical protein
MTIITEIYQWLFVSSIIFIIYIFGGLFIKMYGRFTLKQSTVTFELSIAEKIMLWLSLATFFSYIIN